MNRAQYKGPSAINTMLTKCCVCGRRMRLKAKCMETGKKICRKCCDHKHENCPYKLLCWSNMN